MSLRIFALWLLAALALNTNGPASAQVIDYTPRITVSPLVAPPGVARTVTASGKFLVGCQTAVSGLRISEHPGGQPGLALSLHLITAAIAGGACFSPPATQEYSVSAIYTPSMAGRREIAMFIPEPDAYPIVGFGEIITRESDSKLRAGADFTGVWYEPASNGSGFAFYHSQDQSDVLAGTFYGFDNAGRPFWHLIQAVEWTGDTTFQARLMQLSSAAGSCAFLAGCNRVSTVAQLVGIVRGTLVNPDRLQIELRSGPFPFVMLEEVGRFDLQRLKF